jgi:hypothetical protein
MVCCAMFAASLLACTSPSPHRPPVDPFAGTFMQGLVGDWYVLIHYTDSGAEEPDQLLWEERVWRFRVEGERLRWSIHPVVGFERERGRFEVLPGGEHARSLGAWTPDEEQRAEIAAGLRVSDERHVEKSLRGSVAAGYRSTRRPGADSASMIDYAERWSIEDDGGLPVFTRDAVMGAARVEAIEGRTRYRAVGRSADGDHLEGRYSRDETLSGVFEMFRMKASAGSGAP